MKRLCIALLTLTAIIGSALLAAGLYMLDYSLAPDPGRANTDSCYRQLFARFPYTKPWVDSLRSNRLLRDTFVTMPTGERHHAMYVWNNSRHTAVVIHGWRDCGIKFLYLAHFYEKELGWNVVVPDLHAHGLSEGSAAGMGWLDRKDVLEWMRVFRTDSMTVHGVSMGAATAMMMSAEAMPRGVRNVNFVADCGYTSVWDEFSCQLKEQFGLPPFPLMYVTSALCRLLYGWSFGEADALGQVAKSPYPMLFIHGDSDTFVPTWMALSLYAAKPGHKKLWISPHCGHAESFAKHREEYERLIRPAR